MMTKTKITINHQPTPSQMLYYYPDNSVETLSKLKQQHHVQDTIIDIIATENLYSLIEQHQNQSFVIIALPIYDITDKIINTIEIDIIITQDHIILTTDHHHNFIKNICFKLDTCDHIDDIVHHLIQIFCVHILDSVRQLEHEIALCKNIILHDKHVTKDLIEIIMTNKMNIGILRSTIDPFVNIVDHITDITSTYNQHNKNQNNHYIKQIQSQSKFIYETITIIADSADALQTIHTNNIMKVLAIISTIFIPLSFVTGVFGMNFVDMPGLDWIGWYYVTIGAMFFIGLFQLYVFKRKRRF